MRKNILNIIFNVSFLHKLITCCISLFILVSSICVNEVKNISVLESAKVSASSILVQFFYISTLPANIISKLFVNTEAKSPLSSNENNKNNSNKNKEENSSKSSFGYSIVPDISSYQIVKVKNIKEFSLPDKIKKSRNIIYFENCKFVFKSRILNFSFLIMLLLAILLARRNIGDNNIVLKIKNNRLARLIC